MCCKYVTIKLSLMWVEFSVLQPHWLWTSYSVSVKYKQLQFDTWNRMHRGCCVMTIQRARSTHNWSLKLDLHRNQLMRLGVDCSWNVFISRQNVVSEGTFPTGSLFLVKRRLGMRGHPRWLTGMSLRRPLRRRSGLSCGGWGCPTARSAADRSCTDTVSRLSECGGVLSA